jgi:hypothetical protein
MKKGGGEFCGGGGNLVVFRFHDVFSFSVLGAFAECVGDVVTMGVSCFVSSLFRQETQVRMEVSQFQRFKIQCVRAAIRICGP